MKITWTRHYTGLEYAEKKLGPFDLYLSRTSCKRMARLSAGRRMIGIFLGELNYAREWGRGFELFTNNWHVGVITHRGPSRYRSHQRVRWSGSIAEPYSSLTLRLGRLFVGRRSPGWLKRLKERRAQASWEKQCAAMEEYFDAMHPAQEGEE